MATEVLSLDPIFVTHDGYREVDDVYQQSVFVVAEPLAGGVTALYENKVWDTIGGGGYVTWTTFYQDIGGQEYPGPGIFGVNTSNYVVQSVITSRAQ